MAKALDFIDPDRLSMAVVLTAMNRFLNEVLKKNTHITARVQGGGGGGEGRLG
jgi:hypothetical protein